MFMIEAIIFVVMAGTLPQDPLVIHSVVSFQGIDACQKYMTSPEFGTQREKLTTTLLAALAKVAAANPDDDNSLSRSLRVACPIRGYEKVI